MADERLYQFPSKPTPVPDDIIYIGDSQNSFDEVNSTIEQVISAYPNLLGVAELTMGNSTYAYKSSTGVWTAGAITSFGITLLADVTTAANSVLVTDPSSIASLSQTLPTAVQNNITLLGTQAEALDMGTHLINNVVDPVSAQDAATKSYVDTSASGYLPLTGGTMSGAINMGGFGVTNLPTPSAGSDACTKSYADSIASGITVQGACYAGTTANLTATYNNGTSGVGATLTNSGALAAFSTDGVSPPVNSRILVKNQTTTYQNGIYTLTTVGSGAVAWVLTRATDYNTVANINPGDLVVINNGSSLALSSWIETATVTAIGTDPILFSQFSVAAFGFTSLNYLLIGA